MELAIKNQTDQITHLLLRGRLDTAGAGEVELKFTSHTVPRGKPLLLDMSEVTFLSSLGLRMLFTVAKALDRHGAKMLLLSPQPTVREVLVLPDSISSCLFTKTRGQHWDFLQEAKVDKILASLAALPIFVPLFKCYPLRHILTLLKSTLAFLQVHEISATNQAKIVCHSWRKFGRFSS